MSTTQDLLNVFFSKSVESDLNEKMLDDISYQIPKESLLHYCRQILAIPIEEFLYYLIGKETQTINAAMITQCSSFVDCEKNLIKAMLDYGDTGMSFVEIGECLSSDPENASIVALRKYGENQVKTAKQLGLTFDYYDTWYLNCISYVYFDLSETEQRHLIARNLLRDPFYSQICLTLTVKDICLTDYLSVLSHTTITRRLPNVKCLLGIFISTCEDEGVKLCNCTSSSLPPNHDERIKDEKKLPTQKVSNSLIFPDDIDEDINNSDDESYSENHKRSKSVKFTVKFGDGKTIHYGNSLRTMIEALKYMGLEGASKFTGEDFKGFRLVSREQRITEDDRKWQIYVDGWWIYRNLSNTRKVRCLKGVSKLLNIPLEIIYDEELPEPKHLPKKGKRTMYSLNGSAPYAKNRAVLEAVRLFLQQFPDASFEEVSEMFPASLQGSYGVVRSINDIKQRSQNNKTESDRWFLEPVEILTAHDGVRFAVSSEWGNQFPDFQKHLADNFGWTLTEV